MTNSERTAVIDECIRAVELLRENARTGEPDTEQTIAMVTSAVCTRLIRLKDDYTTIWPFGRMWVRICR
jgi:hypothetical protein